MIDLDGLLEAGCRSKARVGIGVGGSALSRTAELLGERGCHVELVGFDDPEMLVKSLDEGAVEAGVRGVLSSSDTLRAMRTRYRIDAVMRAAVLASSEGKAFILAPVGIDEGRTKPERLALVRSTVAYFRPAGWQPSIGVLSKGRPEDADRGEDISSSLADGAEITRELAEGGIEAAHYHILLEEAVRDSDLVVAPNGVTGNLVFRTLYFLGSGRSFGAPVVNLPAVFVDTSRAKADFVEPVLLAAGLEALGCGRGGHA